MWRFVSNAAARINGVKKDLSPGCVTPKCSDNKNASNTKKEEGLECPICWELFNIVENVPYVLWCGHTLCKNCILNLQSAVVKIPTLPISIPFLIFCPWCSLPSFRLVSGGDLRFPRKNFFLLWLVEGMNGDRVNSHSSLHDDQPVWSLNRNLALRNQASHVDHEQAPNHDVSRFINSVLSVERLYLSLRRFLVSFVHLTAKFPLVVLFLLIILYAIPTSAAILALYILFTVLFAVPSFFVLFFAYPFLGWLIKKIRS